MDRCAVGAGGPRPAAVAWGVKCSRRRQAQRLQGVVASAALVNGGGPGGGGEVPDRDRLVVSARQQAAAVLCEPAPAHPRLVPGVHRATSMSQGLGPSQRTG